MLELVCKCVRQLCRKRFSTDIMQYRSYTTSTLLHFSQKGLQLKVENRFLCSFSERREHREHSLPCSTTHFSCHPGQILQCHGICLAIVHPNYHFCWDGMNHSAGILFSLTPDSTQRTGLDEKSNSEAATARWIPPFASASCFMLIKDSKKTFPYLSGVLWK